MASARLPLTLCGFQPSTSGGKGSARAAARSAAAAVCFVSVTVTFLQGLGEPLVGILEEAQGETRFLMLAFAAGSRPAVLPIETVAGPRRHEIAQAAGRQQGQPGPTLPRAGQQVDLAAEGQTAAAVRQLSRRHGLRPPGLPGSTGPQRAAHGA